VGEPDLSRLLLEASRVLGAEIVAGLQERGFPDARPGHAALFMHIDRRWGTRLTDLARRARMTKQGMMLLVDDLETRGYVRRVPDADDSRAKMVVAHEYLAGARALMNEGRTPVPVLWTSTEEPRAAGGPLHHVKLSIGLDPDALQDVIRWLAKQANGGVP